MALWYYTRNHERQGPVTDLDLKLLAKEGKLGPDDLIWKEGFKDWRPARLAVGLLPAADAPRPQEPPPLPPLAGVGNEAAEPPSPQSTGQTLFVDREGRIADELPPLAAGIQTAVADPWKQVVPPTPLAGSEPSGAFWQHFHPSRCFYLALAVGSIVSLLLPWYVSKAPAWTGVDHTLFAISPLKLGGLWYFVLYYPFVALVGALMGPHKDRVKDGISSWFGGVSALFLGLLLVIGSEMRQQTKQYVEANKDILMLQAQSLVEKRFDGKVLNRERFLDVLKDQRVEPGSGVILYGVCCFLAAGWGAHAFQRTQKP